MKRPDLGPVGFGKTIARPLFSPALTRLLARQNSARASVLRSASAARAVRPLLVPVPCSACRRDGPGRSRRRSHMPAIGYVTKNNDGSFKGQLKTLSISAEIAIVSNRSKSADTQPDYRVLSDGVEIGAGWNRRS